MFKNKEWANQISKCSFALGLAVLLSACGGAYKGPLLPASDGGFQFPLLPGNGGNGPGSGGFTEPAPNFNATLSGLRFELTGHSGSASSATLNGIITDDVLKVRITAGDPENITYSDCENCNFTPTVGCVSYNLTVAGKTVKTPPLRVQGTPESPLCKDAKEAVVYDFSSQLAPGHGAVSLTVSQANYDFQCQTALKCEQWAPYMFAYWTPEGASYWNTGCQNISKQFACSTLKPLHYTHTVTGFVDLELDSAETLY